jgi:hypothetical protein
MPVATDLNTSRGGLSQGKLDLMPLGETTKRRGAFSRRGLRAYHANIRALPLLHFGPIAMSQSEVRVKSKRKLLQASAGLIEMQLKPARDCLSML